MTDAFALSRILAKTEYYSKEDAMALKQKMSSKPPEDNADNADNVAWTWVKVPARAHHLIGCYVERLDG